MRRDRTRSFRAGIAAFLSTAICGIAPSCARTESPKPVGGKASDASAVAVAERADGGRDAAKPGGAIGTAWVDAVRRGDYARARELWPKARSELVQHPAARFAHAKTLSELGDHAGVIRALDNLEAELPLLSKRIAELRARAKLHVGPYEDAARYFAARTDVASLLDAADANAKAKLDGPALSLYARVLSTRSASASQAARARCGRSRLDASATKRNIEDWKWIATHTPASACGDEAIRALDKAGAAGKLDAKALLNRADKLAHAGRTDDALGAVALAERRQQGTTKEERLLRKAQVLYANRHRATLAAKAFDDVARLGGKHANEARFLAARSLARADRDDAAITRLRRLAKLTKGTYGEQAEYLAAHLELIHARWTKAAASFDTYLARHRTGAHHARAERERALAHLMAGHHKSARSRFERLAGRDKPSRKEATARNLAALAALKAGDRRHAIARFRETIRDRPLSWPALVARSRLRALGVGPLPPLVAQASATKPAPPLDIALPDVVRDLHDVGLDADAEEELSTREASLTQKAGSRSTEALCELYAKLGRGRRRLQLSRRIPASIFETAPTKSTRWAWECAFPSPFADIVRSEEKATHLPQGIVWALMRQESAFYPRAISPARAVGLMQLLPETADRTAKREHIALPDGALFQPSANITLGARYLHQVLTELRHQLVLGVAAYNAGPDRIAKWVRRTPDIDIEVWVESIPFDETRDYVAIVMENFAHYQMAYGTGHFEVPLTARL